MKNNEVLSVEGTETQRFHTGAVIVSERNYLWFSVGLIGSFVAVALSILFFY